MQFRTHFNRSGMTKQAYAEKIGVSHTTVVRILRDQLPSPKTMLAIFLESGGRVQPNDWYPEIAEARKALKAD